MWISSWLKLFSSGHHKTRQSHRELGRHQLVESLEYRILLSAAPAVDLDANDSSGATGASFSTAFTEGGSPVAIADLDATVADADSADLSSLTVTLTNIQNAGQELLAATTAGTSISKSYNPSTGVLTLSGTDTVANYQAVLRTVTYSNNSDTPGTTARLINVIATDDDPTPGNSSNTATATVSVAASNDAPVNTVPSGLQQTRASRTLVFSTANGNAISVADADAGANAIQVTLTAVNGTLTLSSTTGLDFTFATDANGAGSGDGAADTTMTFRGTITDINSALNGLRYVPNPGPFASQSGRLTIATNDLGNTGAGGALVDTDTVTITHNPTAYLARMRRAYNPNADMHFFTTSAAEFGHVVAAGYHDESTGNAGFNIVTDAEDGAAALHRLYNPNDGAHYYTYNTAEEQHLVSVGWTFEKDEGYILTVQTPGTTEVFRLYNINSGVHLFTENVGTKNAILAAFPGVWVQHSSLGFGIAEAAPSSGAASRPSASSPASHPATSALAPTNTSLGDGLTTASSAVSDSVVSRSGTTLVVTAPPTNTPGASVSQNAAHWPTVSIKVTPGSHAAEVTRDAVADVDSFWSKVGSGLTDGATLLD